MTTIIPDRETLFHEFHELRKIAHHRELLIAPFLRSITVGFELRLDDIEASRLVFGGFGIKNPKTPN